MLLLSSYYNFDVFPQSPKVNSVCFLCTTRTLAEKNYYRILLKRLSKNISREGALFLKFIGNAIIITQSMLNVCLNTSRLCYSRSCWCSWCSASCKLTFVVRFEHYINSTQSLTWKPQR